MTGVSNARETGSDTEHGGRDGGNAHSPRASKRATCGPTSREATRDEEDGIEANVAHVTTPINYPTSDEEG